ncbi:MAG TPA: pyridoxamine 5'-phosphate oxidase family protein [Actinomycetota bacterium]|nr:pyridoxamine 5'-phosphate oxidase family protein [Actinomycetota bacterium]
MSEPRPARPSMPPGYGIASDERGLLPWSWAEERLSASRNYWIVTADEAGRPHAMPVWGLWLDGSVWFSSDGDSRKARNIANRREIVVHLESGDEAVIVEGNAEEVSDREALVPFARAYEVKYGFGFDLDHPIGLVYRVRPRVVLGWREKDFPSTATRWVFI